MILRWFGFQNLSHAFDSSQCRLIPSVHNNDTMKRNPRWLENPLDWAVSCVENGYTVPPGNGPIADERKCTINMTLEGTWPRGKKSKMTRNYTRSPRTTKKKGAASGHRTRGDGGGSSTIQITGVLVSAKRNRHFARRSSSGRTNWPA